MRIKSSLPSFILFLTAHSISAQENPKLVYMFSYFDNYGTDGLHPAYSSDSYTWIALNIWN